MNFFYLHNIDELCNNLECMHFLHLEHQWITIIHSVIVNL